MNIKFSNKTIGIFEKGFARLANYHSLIKNSTALISYSGGKDSTFLLHFYTYLFQSKGIKEPVLFHLNHSIRKNDLQELELFNYIKEKFYFLFFCKKKTFHYCLNY